jgi:transposase
MAAWDVHRAKLFGACETKTGIESFHRLVDLVMTQEPYRSAQRVFWVTDNGSSHRSPKSVSRLAQWYPNALLVPTPIHASWLNQIEIYFSVVQRKVLAPNECDSLAELEQRLLAFQSHYETIAQPFKWQFTREDLKPVLAQLSQYHPQSNQLAA